MPVRAIQKKWAPRALLFPWEIGGYPRHVRAERARADSCNEAQTGRDVDRRVSISSRMRAEKSKMQSKPPVGEKAWSCTRTTEDTGNTEKY
jgi:hypothetical protein